MNKITGIDYPPPTSNRLRGFFRGGSLKCGTAYKESKTSRSGIPRNS